MSQPALSRGVRRVAIAAIVAVVAACGIVPKKEPLSLYAPDARLQADPAWPTVDWALQVPRPHASELHDSPRIVVRPADGQLQVYQGAIWAAPAPDLLQDTVLRAFEDSGRITGVARRGTGVSGDYVLLLDIRRFESDYAGGSTPNAEVEIRAQLVANTRNAVVAARTLRQSVPAGDTSVEDVSRAFGTALSAVVRDLVGWTLAEGQKDDGAQARAATRD